MFGITPKNGATAPIDCSPASLHGEAGSPSRSTRGPGRNGASAALTAFAPAPGPPQPCGVPNVLCRLKWQTSKPASRARVMPRMPLAFAWSYDGERADARARHPPTRLIAGL